ncbi:MAG: DNA polymerase III subunit chi [Methylohalobius sp.]|nr:DNA polymerase III subunit chi [Methylohalobius sp.]
MRRVDFYLLQDQDPKARRAFACRLAEKAYKLDHKVFIRVEDETDAQILDELLWTFRQGSFVPHTLADNLPHDPLAAVVIGFRDTPEPCPTVLINLSSQVPADWQRFQRIAEIVTQDQATRTAGRSKYRSYQDLGVHLHLHRLTSA